MADGVAAVFSAAVLEGALVSLPIAGCGTPAGVMLPVVLPPNAALEPLSTLVRGLLVPRTLDRRDGEIIGPLIRLECSWRDAPEEPPLVELKRLPLPAAVLALLPPRLDVPLMKDGERFLDSVPPCSNVGCDIAGMGSLPICTSRMRSGKGRMNEYTRTNQESHGTCTSAKHQ